MGNRIFMCKYSYIYTVLCTVTYNMRRGYFGANGARITVRMVAVDKLSCVSSKLYAKKRPPPPRNHSYEEQHG